MGFRFRYISLFVILIAIILGSCSKKVSYKGKKVLSKCSKRVVYTTVYFCNKKYAYSNKFQHLSKIRVVDSSTGKKITIGVRHSNYVKGLCLPKRYRKFFGKDRFTAKVYILRCGQRGLRYCPTEFRGYASWYGKEFAGRKTASGKPFNPYGFYAAHRYLPFGTLLEVKNLKNGKKVVVEVIDRGPFVRGRHLDLSYAAARKLGMIKDGVVPFKARVIRCGK